MCSLPAQTVLGMKILRSVVVHRISCEIPTVSDIVWNADIVMRRAARAGSPAAALTAILTGTTVISGLPLSISAITRLSALTIFAATAILSIAAIIAIVVSFAALSVGISNAIVSVVRLACLSLDKL